MAVRRAYERPGLSFASLTEALGLVSSLLQGRHWRSAMHIMSTSVAPDALMCKLSHSDEERVRDALQGCLDRASHALEMDVFACMDERLAVATLRDLLHGASISEELAVREPTAVSAAALQALLHARASFRASAGVGAGAGGAGAGGAGTACMGMTTASLPLVQTALVLLDKAREVLPFTLPDARPDAPQGLRATEARTMHAVGVSTDVPVGVGRRRRAAGDCFDPIASALRDAPVQSMRTLLGVQDACTILAQQAERALTYAKLVGDEVVGGAPEGPMSAHMAPAMLAEWRLRVSDRHGRAMVDAGVEQLARTRSLATY